LRGFLAEVGREVSKTKNTHFSSKYKSQVGRRGKRRAIIASGHKIPIAVYSIIKDKIEFRELGEEYLNNFGRDKLIAYYKK